MVYNFNLGIGWASSGVEYAQSYRANLLRRAHIPARFVFTDMFPTENIEHMTRNIGFLDEEVIWLYTFFTDVRTSPVTFTLKELEASMAEEDYTFSREGKTCRYQFKESGRFYTCYMVDDTSDLVHRVEIVSNGCLIRKDFYTYCRTFSEYYAPLDGKAHMYGRTFFNEDGSVCYEEVIEDDSTFYRIGAQVLYTKADLVGYMVKRLNLTADDVVIIDRTTGIGQAILENCGPARVGIVVHADHTAVYFNSLSYPFFASQALAPNGFRDALFWHEPVGDEIPGNMQIILHDQGTRAKRVFVSRRESYDRLIALGAPSDKVKLLGYIYSFVRENKHRPHILVCTNSENVGHLTELASLMPQMHFHVAAITEMSSKLMSAGQYDNVSLYPNVKMSVLDSLFEKCDFYLDINHEGEIVDAVHRAFLNNMLIVGYEETMHNAYYTADTNTFKESEYADMAEALNLTLAMPHLIDEALAMQKKAAVAADATDYMEILHL